MKITHLSETDEVWPFFYDFCIKSKPYDFCCIPSKKIRDKKIKNSFEDYSDSIVYKAEHNGKVMGFVFLEEQECCLDVNFIFGVRKNFTSPKLITAAHAIFDDALIKFNKKYLKSQVRRTFKIESYIKWVDRYDKRAIILADDKKTIVWCNSDRMSVKFKVVGANKATEHLLGKEAEMGYTRKGPRTTIRELFFDDKKYILDEKSVDFLPEFVLIHGFLSDDKKAVGKIALEFKPKK
jgi:hypothetical protein|tara:strand:+ start:4656 stop:5366 length:711 start_codon:yes stop_codon:yes gene_type:complete